MEAAFVISCYNKPLLKGAYSKRKEIIPKGAEIPFVLDPCHQGKQNIFDGVTSSQAE